MHSRSPAIQSTETVRGYHAHVYYDDGTREHAERLREALGDRFQVRLGRWHPRPVGPHPRAMYQVAFAPDQLSGLLPFLMLNRGECPVLLHPETGDDVRDHTRHAVWLGGPLELDIDFLAGQDPAAGG